MDKSVINKIENFKKSYGVKDVELVKCVEDGYIGKRSYKVTLNDSSSMIVDKITKNKNNGDAIVIVPITEDKRFVMVIQSRVNTLEGVCLEFPAGMVEACENKSEAARRELLEETGYEADYMEELEWHYQDQGCSSAIVKTYVAYGCKRVDALNLDENEKLDVLLMSKEDLKEAFNDAKYGINDANSKIAYMSYVLKKEVKL